MYAIRAVPSQGKRNQYQNNPARFDSTLDILRRI